MPKRQTGGFAIVQIQAALYIQILINVIMWQCNGLMCCNNTYDAIMVVLQYSIREVGTAVSIYSHVDENNDDNMQS